MINIFIRTITPDDHDQWMKLYQGYVTFCRRTFDKVSIDTLWQWIMENKIFCLIALVDNQMVGLAHAKEQLSPLNGKVVGYLDDLFVIPPYRGKGVAYQLMVHLKLLGESKKWLFIRWITRENNYRAKAFYDKIAEKTKWHTYQLSLQVPNRT